MKKLIVALALAVPMSALAGEPAAKPVAEAKGETKGAKFGMASVKEVANWNADKKAVVFDANNPEFRAANGTVPGAKLLTSPSSYDVAKELPSDKASTVVFYCANTKCHASHAAAERAAAAGFTNVKVMGEGLMGWKAAGNPVDMPKS